MEQSEQNACLFAYDATPVLYKVNGEMCGFFQSQECYYQSFSNLFVS